MMQAEPDGAAPPRAPNPPRQAAASSLLAYAAMPGTPKKRCIDPRGLLFGTWKGAELRAVHSNAVYGSRDIKNRIKRRISKESPSGNVVVGNFNHKSNWNGKLVMGAEEADRETGDTREDFVVLESRKALATVGRVPSGDEQEEDNGPDSEP